MVAALLSLAVMVAQPAAPSTAAPEVVDLSAVVGELDATFVLLDTGSGRVRVHGPARAATRFTPASTFKIPNSIIALETGVATGPEFPLAWDERAAPSQPWWPKSWPRDQTLRTAFKSSVVWYYQELARRIGPERMRDFVQRWGYGNRDLSGPIDRFWLESSLAISANEQVEFLRRFLAGGLGISDETTRIVRDLALIEETPDYRLSGKTGTAEITAERELGWLVGWVERDGRTSVYALNMEGDSVWEDWPPQRRAELVRRLLAALEVIPKPTQ